jgi:hypothetical protein
VVCLGWLGGNSFDFSLFNLERNNMKKLLTLLITLLLCACATRLVVLVETDEASKNSKLNITNNNEGEE